MAEEVKMLKNQSVTRQAVEELKNLEEQQEVQETPNKDVEEYAITNDQLAQIRALYNRRIKTQVRKFGKIGRNDLCPCGSGKKYKHCCLSKGTYEELTDMQ